MHTPQETGEKGSNRTGTPWIMTRREFWTSSLALLLAGCVPEALATQPADFFPTPPRAVTPVAGEVIEPGEVQPGEGETVPVTAESLLAAYPEASVFDEMSLPPVVTSTILNWKDAPAEDKELAIAFWAALQEQTLIAHGIDLETELVGVDPAVRLITLMGMLMQQERTQLITREVPLPFITPWEIEAITRQEVFKLRGDKSSGIARGFGLDDFVVETRESGYPGYSIAGRAPFKAANGDVLGIYRVFGDSGAYFLELGMWGPPDSDGQKAYSLWGGVARLRSYTIGEGYIVHGAYPYPENRTIAPFELPADFELSLHQLIGVEEGFLSLDQLLNLLGKNIEVRKYSFPKEFLLPDGKSLSILYVVDSSTGVVVDLIGVIQSSVQADDPDLPFPALWPWSKPENSSGQ